MVQSRSTEDMKVYFESEEWKAKIAGDDLLFHAANLIQLRILVTKVPSVSSTV
jgi:hypothetical protein